MKLIIIVNNATNTFEFAIPSRDLAAEELAHLYELTGHGTERTLHYADCHDRALPFTDILVEVAKYLGAIPNKDIT